MAQRWPAEQWWVYLSQRKAQGDDLTFRDQLCRRTKVLGTAQGDAAEVAIEDVPGMPHVQLVDKGQLVVARKPHFISHSFTSFWPVSGGQPFEPSAVEQQRRASARLEVAYLAEHDHVIAGLHLIRDLTFDRGQCAVEQ